MKKIINILLVCIAIAGAFSCAPRKQVKTSPKHDRQAIVRLSKQFGLRLTPADNIALYDACSGWLGVKYRNGGNSKKGVDCSGLTSILYKQVYGTPLERSSANIFRKNCIQINRNNLREGDLVFFRTSGSGRSKTPTHVGIYLKGGKFIHASTSKGVIISSLSEAYYVRTWLSGGRIRSI